MSGRALLVADEVSHHFRSPTGEISALHQVSIRVAEGEFLSIVGPSGCGKTTLLRMFGGLTTPETGRILLDGRPLRHPPDRTGFVFQQPALLPWRTVEENVALPLRLGGQPERAARVAAMIRSVGLDGFERALPAALSGGMQQRVSLARALVTGPRLLLMDEPFGALDMILRSEMNLLLLELWRANQATVVFVTHDLHEAVFMSDRVVVMSRRPGRVVGNLPIDLPRPRAALDRYGSDVQGNVERIWHELMHDA